MNPFWLATALIALAGAAQAQTGLGFSGSPSSPVVEGLVGIVPVAFSGLLLWGLFGALEALTPAATLSPQHRVASRWIGLNRLEPSVTTLLVETIAVLRVRSGSSGLSPVWLVLPLVSFLGMLLPPIWFTSSDPVIQRVWRDLRRITVARAAPLIAVSLGLALDQAWVATSALLIGLGALCWSWVVLARLAHRIAVNGRMVNGTRSLKHHT